MKITEREAYIYLADQDINQSLSGFDFLISSICIACEKPIKTCELYEEVAIKHKTTPKRVERCIRHAIIDKRLINSEFIARSVNVFKYGKFAERTTT